MFASSMCYSLLREGATAKARIKRPPLLMRFARAGLCRGAREDVGDRPESVKGLYAGAFIVDYGSRSAGGAFCGCRAQCGHACGEPVGHGGYLLVWPESLGTRFEDNHSRWRVQCSYTWGGTQVQTRHIDS